MLFLIERAGDLPFVKALQPVSFALFLTQNHQLMPDPFSASIASRTPSAPISVHSFLPSLPALPRRRPTGKSSPRLSVPSSLSVSSPKSKSSCGKTLFDRSSSTPSTATPSRLRPNLQLSRHIPRTFLRPIVSSLSPFRPHIETERTPRRSQRSTTASSRSLRTTAGCYSTSRSAYWRLNPTDEESTRTGQFRRRARRRRSRGSRS